MRWTFVVAAILAVVMSQALSAAQGIDGVRVITPQDAQFSGLVQSIAGDTRALLLEHCVILHNTGPEPIIGHGVIFQYPPESYNPSGPTTYLSNFDKVPLPPGSKAIAMPYLILNGPPDDDLHARVLARIHLEYQSKPAPVSYHLDWIRYADGSLAGPDTRDALSLINADLESGDKLAEDLASAGDQRAVLEEAIANHKPRPIDPEAFFRSQNARFLLKQLDENQNLDLAAKARSISAHRRHHTPRAHRK